jgi:hypothetical protein
VDGVAISYDGQAPVKAFSIMAIRKGSDLPGVGANTEGAITLVRHGIVPAPRRHGRFEWLCALEPAFVNGGKNELDAPRPTPVPPQVL